MRVVLDLPTLVFAFAALGNLCALVWGAARVSAAVNRLTAWADVAEQKLVNHETRIATIEGAIGGVT